MNGTDLCWERRPDNRTGVFTDDSVISVNAKLARKKYIGVCKW